jgi:heme exporter protein D
MMWAALGASSVALIVSLVAIFLARRDRAYLREVESRLAVVRRELENAAHALEVLAGPDPTLDDLDRVSETESGPEAA